MGVTSLKLPADGAFPPDRIGYDHVCVSVATFPVLICASGEKRVLARSWLYIGQSPALCACAGREIMQARTKTNANRIVRSENVNKGPPGGNLFSDRRRL
jgi:hypothetical protein